MVAFLELSFDLGTLDALTVETAAFDCGAFAVTLVDAREDTPVSHPTKSGPTPEASLSPPSETPDFAGTPVSHPTKSGPTLQASLSPRGETPDFAGTPVLEPAPGETPLWPATRVKCLFANAPAPGVATATVAAALATTLGIDASQIETRTLADRAWEREWLKDFHAMRFGRRLWVCPNHERASAPDAVVVSLDPGLAFGTGTHASTALCLEWLDEYFQESPVPAEHFEENHAPGVEAPYPPGTRVIDYGCGSGVLGIAAARLGATEVHAYDIDPQALIATADNARANDVQTRLRVHASDATLPSGTDVLLANILAAPLCLLVARFAALLRPGGQVVLAGLMSHQVPEVTAAYAACFDVVRFGERDGWACLAGRRR